MNASAPQEPGPAILDLWQPVAILDDLRAGETMRTKLLDRDVAAGADWCRATWSGAACSAGGGSRYMHDSVKVGDLLDLSEPCNNFPLRRDAARTLRIAGGMSLLDGLRNAGVDLPSSCEQGACGPCIATVADIAVFPDVALSGEGGISHEDYPALRRWAERVQRLPGFVDMPGVLPVAPLPYPPT
ncbi:MAG: 2Fe-2S iron-sulfur cluster-binding protein [bacterium]|nr:2Fe-2S iron-sulfur cluster-binding protein [bacterium]